MSDNADINASGDHGLAFKAQSYWPSGVKVTSCGASSVARDQHNTGNPSLDKSVKVLLDGGHCPRRGKPRGLTFFSPKSDCLGLRCSAALTLDNISLNISLFPKNDSEVL